MSLVEYGFVKAVEESVCGRAYQTKKNHAG